MTDDNFELTRRKVLGGLGGIGAGAALGGTGTMAFLNDTETSEHNSVTAGSLDLKLDWYQWYYQGRATPEKNWDYQGLTNDPGPIFQIEDAKPGDCGFGCISVHNEYNPAYVWAGCDLEQWERGLKDPEDEVDTTPEKAELAENVKVALVRHPYVNDTDALASDQEDLQNQMEAQVTGARAFSAMSGCTCLFVTTLADLCENKLHGGHLLDGKPYGDGRCFRKGHTYFYSFAWWIPEDVGNEIQSDELEFTLKFGAVQCRHLSVEDAKNYNPFADANGPSDNNTD